MSELLLVGMGSFIGGISRYYLGGIILHASGASRFPFGTLIINIVGCLLMGIVAGVAESQHVISPNARLFLMTGILGGFTTFSAFGYETIFLLRTGEPVAAGIYVILSVTIGLVATWLGMKITLNF